MLLWTLHMRTLSTRLLSTTSVAFLLGLGGLGCGSTTSEAPPSSTPPPTTTTEPTPSIEPTPATTATFDVHEWGLVDVPLSGPAEIGAGPGQPDGSVMSVRKPVIYVHADPGSAPITLDVVARFPSGELVEHWPTTSEWQSTSADATSIAWRGLAVGACDASASATRGPVSERAARACATVDGYCEVADLPQYVTDDASCLSASGFQTSLLFYRGRTTQASLPLSVASSATELSITSSVAGGAGVLYVRQGRGIEIPWPGPGGTIPLPDAFSESFDGPALTRILASRLAAAGLTTSEVDAFLRAWAEPLFGTSWPLDEDQAARRDLSVRSRRPIAGPPPTLIYVMPEATVSQLAELTITPTPRSVRRVMVVRVDLPR